MGTAGEKGGEEREGEWENREGKEGEGEREGKEKKSEAIERDFCGIQAFPKHNSLWELSQHTHCLTRLPCIPGCLM